MKKKLELLAPAGDMASLKAAIASGANAIYLGGNAFSARAYAKNFNREELKEAVAYAHLRDVKIHVTCNILYKDEEYEQLLDYIDYLYTMDVDAILIQDIGLLKLVRQYYPDFEVHVSTQMSLTSLAAVRYFEKLGVTRVVLARETPLENIRYICENSPLEVEVFAHGAICVAYSGQCLMSSMIGKRSGNRGACAQPCRLPYTLKEDGQTLNKEPVYLISPRDLCTIDHMQDFIEAGVTSIKLEGRMKKPEYVAAIVKGYRKAIDHVYDQTPDYTKEDVNDMKQMFNRQYTHGYAFSDYKLVDGDFPGNRGMPLGEVMGYSKKHRTVRLHLTHELNQGDSILLTAIDAGRPVNKMYQRGKLVNQALPGEDVDIEFDTYCDHGEVRKTVSTKLIKSLDTLIHQPRSYRILDLELYAYEGAPLTLVGRCDGLSVEASLEENIDHVKPLTDERIKAQLGKLGSTVYKPGEIAIYRNEDVAIKVSSLNALRREVTEKMDQALMNVQRSGKTLTLPAPIMQPYEKRMIITVHTLAQLEALMDHYEYLYYYYDEHIEDALALFAKHHHVAGVYLPRILYDQEINDLQKHLQDVSRVIVNDYGSFDLFKKRDVILGPGMNIFNHYSANSFDQSAIISYECDASALETMKQVAHEMILPVYGYIENMVLEHCVVSQYYHHKKIPHCNKCRGHTYELFDRKQVGFKVFTDAYCRNHILHNMPLYIRHHQRYPFSAFVMFYDEKNPLALMRQIEAEKALTDGNNQSIATTKGYLK